MYCIYKIISNDFLKTLFYSVVEVVYRIFLKDFSHYIVWYHDRAMNVSGTESDTGYYAH